jgi:hypothetical protein
MFSDHTVSVLFLLIFEAQSAPLMADVPCRKDMIHPRRAVKPAWAIAGCFE